MEMFFAITIIVLLILLIILIFIYRDRTNNELPQLQIKVTELQSSLTKIESNLKEDFHINREENATIAKDNRLEINNTLKNITEQSQSALKEINKTLAEKVDLLNSKIDDNNKANREV